MKNISKFVSILLCFSIILSAFPVASLIGAKKDTDDMITFSAKKYCGYNIDCYYSDGYFKKAASEYNPSLATASILLTSAGGYSATSSSLSGMLEAFKFGAVEFNDDFLTQPTRDSMGIAAAMKQAVLNGENTTIIAVAFRCGNYTSEWASNFTMGLSGDHAGFSAGADKTVAFLNSYISRHSASVNKNVKLWITGYSRGAAVANLTAARLTLSGRSGGKSFGPEDIYAYCFETPLAASSANVKKHPVMSNIHNLMNSGDLVTNIPMKEWGFTVYGVKEDVLPKNKQAVSPETYANMIKTFDSFDSSEFNTCVEDGELSGDKFMAKHIKTTVVKGHFETVKIFYTKSLIWIPAHTELSVVDNPNVSIDKFLDNLSSLLAKSFGSRKIYVQKYQTFFRALADSIGSNVSVEKLIASGNSNLALSAENMVSAYYESGESALSSYISDTLMKLIKDVVSDKEVLRQLPVIITDLSIALGRVFAESIRKDGGDTLVTLAKNLMNVICPHFPGYELSWIVIQDPNYYAI